MAKTVWEKVDEQGFASIMSFNEDYKTFLDASKTERLFTTNAVKAAEEAGYKNLEDVTTLNPGDKVYVVNRGKNFFSFIIGEEPLVNGMNILGAHLDSPRLDLKQHPLYEKDGLALLDTHYYGGIKKYQWVAHPLAFSWCCS